ncbi:MAG: DUF3291 domain-containing protein [Chroococcidiopsidaceae cyanobacterium CP_BM_RX_35]|nr:DUF3291 domain-containing protein [Chroococcidiopsidaceae cyanobacterium CP_BM_RX_35]
MTLISVTRLRLRSLDYLPDFLEYGDRSLSQAEYAPGNLHTTTREQTQTAFWTLTAWEDEASMQAFMLAGDHREAMTKLVEWADEASTVHWHQDSSELPTWEIAEQWMTKGSVIN